MLRIAMSYNQNMSSPKFIHFSLYSTGLSQEGFHLDVEVINKHGSVWIPLILLYNLVFEISFFIQDFLQKS